MVTLLLVMLVVLDLFLLGLIYFMNKQRFNPVELLKEVSNERKLLKEMRESIQVELQEKYRKAEEIYKKINSLAAEAEVEVKKSTELLSKEMADVLDEFGHRLSNSGEQITRQKTALGATLQRAAKERELLKKVVARGEKLSKFFDRKIPYEEVLEEIEDKKYLDARHLLSKGLTAGEVAQEVGLSESEVCLIASIG
ncbi:DUF2802 domain-containing protein [Pseudobacteriovorax antillogorgiicola]|uniref:DUF2802 domain-containing protein n=1 Tax=Pseudobacteriovorax antillogorgiicola TaxID=1513793 RepID=A0A1Y6CHT6_9BACT|nr:DUF2802 domain-containing protein [Pseudobacteriovorax antillogorgiicola]TCS46650.1 uncharacterized protein DUF2802 [Pseudobacteriovorax antillogorgiicola]SMF66380.1 Protein of unknown function [Pseudobacteriovorax antillogorgiicola]